MALTFTLFLRNIFCKGANRICNLSGIAFFAKQNVKYSRDLEIDDFYNVILYVDKLNELCKASLECVFFNLSFTRLNYRC